MTQAIDNFVQYYKDFNLADNEQFEKVYAIDVKFIDPFHQIQGRQQLLQYFEKMMERVVECHFEILDVCEKDQSAVVVWDMSFRHKSIKKSQLIKVPGTTHIKFQDGKIIYHRDFFDSAQLIYKNIPFIGRVIRFIEGRM